MKVDDDNPLKTLYNEQVHGRRFWFHELLATELTSRFYPKKVFDIRCGAGGDD